MTATDTLEHTSADTQAAADKRLGRFLALRQAQPFAWGTADCCTFAFDAVAALHGRDPVAALRGSYSSATGALRVLARFGGIEGLADQHLGPRIAVHQVQDGDIALLHPWVREDDHGTGALGVAYGPGIVSQGARALVMVPRDAALAWWRAA